MLAISYWIFTGFIVGLLVIMVFLFQLSIRLQREFMAEMENRLRNCCNDK